MADYRLETLARRCGIDVTLSDGQGRTRDVSRETIQSILHALGVEADTERHGAESLAALEREDWQAVIASVIVADATDVAVEVTLPGATRQLSWQLLCEDGSQRAGEVAFADLALIGRDDGDFRLGRRKERRRLVLGAVPLGYHRLVIEPQSSMATLIVTPRRCFLPADERRLWGLALQLYLLRSERNFGCGDFGDLAALGADMTKIGCDVLGLNPLHAPFPDDPEHASPYSPASRVLLNPLNIDVAAAREVRESPAAAALLGSNDFAAELARCRAAASVDYGGVAALKQRVMKLAFADWRTADGETSSDFTAFRAERGAAFERHCLYFALRAHMLAEGLGAGDWHRWPQPYQDSRAAVVARFARTHADEVTWVAWQQWLADRQLAAAAHACGDMRIGLYRDLAVGADAAGAETWAERELLVSDLNIGAPPDPMNATGQEWGLPPPHPQRMQEGGYRSIVDLLRANMRHAGALRIDHVMALERLYVIPKGAPATDGAYLAYPFADLSGVVALESARERCVIVGEDLGNVPPGFRERLAAANVLSYRVLRFERDGTGAFTPPQQYPRLAVAVFGNHDLPTLRGWWEGGDLLLERAHGVTDAYGLAAARERRAADKRALLELLRNEGLLTADAGEPTFELLVVAVHALLGRTQALMTLVQLDDVLRELAPVNVPSVQQFPNWRRAYSQNVERLAREPLLAAVAAALGAQRGRSVLRTAP